MTAETIYLATINFCGGSSQTSPMADFNDDYNADYRIGEESAENEE